MYWLFKSEPSTWSWQDQCTAGNAEWDGVRNYQAQNYMRQMKMSELGFFYHSVTEKSIKGIVEITKLWYPDPSDTTGRFGMVDVKAMQSLVHCVTLAMIKADKRLADIALVRQGRLSVMPLDAQAWRIICEMGGVKP